MICAHATYQISQLAPPSGVSGNSFAYAIGNGNTVGGVTTMVAAGYCAATHDVPVKWSINTSTYAITSSTISLLSGATGGVAYGVNKYGEIVGQDEGFTGGLLSVSAFYCSASGSVSALPAITSDFQGYYCIPMLASSIDDASNIAGELSRFTSPTSHLAAPAANFAFRGTTASLTELQSTPTVGGAYPVGSLAFHIAEVGGIPYAAGWSCWVDPTSFDQYPTAFSSTSAPIASFGDLNGWETTSVAYGNNSSNATCGAVGPYGGTTTVPFLRTNGGAVTILTTNNGEARSIDDSGDVVGWMNVSGARHAFIHYNGVSGVTDLNSLITASGWVLQTAYCINNSGVIVGAGTLNGTPTAFVLH